MCCFYRRHWIDFQKRIHTFNKKLNQNKNSNVQNKTHFVLRTHDPSNIFLRRFTQDFILYLLCFLWVFLPIHQIKNPSLFLRFYLCLSFFHNRSQKIYCRIFFYEISSVNNSRGNFFFQMSVKLHDNIFIVMLLNSIHLFCFFFLRNKLFLQIPRWSFCIAIRSLPILHTSFTNTHIHLLFLLSQRVAQLSWRCFV